MTSSLNIDPRLIALSRVDNWDDKYVDRDCYIREKPSLFRQFFQTVSCGCCCRTPKEDYEGASRTINQLVKECREAYTNTSGQDTIKKASFAFNNLRSIINKQRGALPEDLALDVDKIFAAPKSSSSKQTELFIPRLPPALAAVSTASSTRLIDELPKITSTAQAQSVTATTTTAASTTTIVVPVKQETLQKV